MEERITRGKAIRLKCLDCCGGNTVEVRLCKIRECPLWRFRMGREALAEIEGDAGESQAMVARQDPVPPPKETPPK